MNGFIGSVSIFTSILQSYDACQDRRTHNHSHDRSSRHPIRSHRRICILDILLPLCCPPSIATVRTLILSEDIFIQQLSHRVSSNSATGCSNEDSKQTTNRSSHARTYETTYGCSCATCGNRGHIATSSSSKQGRHTSDRRYRVAFVFATSRTNHFSITFLFCV